MGPWIWFNLLLFSEGHWTYVDAYETLESCVEAQHEIEKTKPGNYYCLPANVLKSQYEVRDPKKVS
jgi:hypothetical protein